MIPAPGSDMNVLRRRRKHPSAAELILLYHRVSSLDTDPWQLAVSPRRFREQMRWVRDHCCAASLADMTNLPQRQVSPRLRVAVTFDDGYADNLHEALPVLEQLEIPATFFLTIPWLAPSREF